MSTSTLEKKPRWRDLLWQLGWTSVEIAGVGLGLAFGLVLHEWEGAFVIWGILLALSLLIRFAHYSQIAQRSSGA